VGRQVGLADVRLDLDDPGDALPLLADEPRADQAAGGLERRAGEEPPQPLRRLDVSSSP